MTIDKREKEFNKRHGVLYGTEYRAGHPESGMTIKIFDKSGGVHAKVKLNETMLRGLRDRINDIFASESEE